MAQVLEQADEKMLRRAAEESAQWAVEQVQLRGPVIGDALARVASLDLGPSDQRRALANLVGELDKRAWDLQDGAERGEATEEEYVAAFARARAASAVWFALTRIRAELGPRRCTKLPPRRPSCHASEI